MTKAELLTLLAEIPDETEIWIEHPDTGDIEPAQKAELYNEYFVIAS